MRIVAGAWRGRTLVAPPGQATRPTADRVRQALFDTLMHAEWGGRAVIDGAVVLDVFAGTGALGLEALSRGAASACFIESDARALRALRANIAACKAAHRTEILAVDVLSAPGRVLEAEARQKQALFDDARHTSQSNLWRQRDETDGRSGEGGAAIGKSGAAMTPASLVFLDPPYGLDLVPRAIERLLRIGRIRSDALIVAETGRDDTWQPEQPTLAEREYGAARILIFRAA
jgi:16S rRNA (guanine966-N2)-methyltransferase